jgi:hypothetical protein
MLLLLSFHAIATQRGDGLHPVLLARLRHIAAGRVEQVVTEPGREEEGGLGTTASHVARGGIAPRCCLRTRKGK